MSTLAGVGVAPLDDPLDPPRGVAHDAPEIVADGLGALKGEHRRGRAGRAMRIDQPAACRRRPADGRRSAPARLPGTRPAPAAGHGGVAGSRACCCTAGGRPARYQLLQLAGIRRHDHHRRRCLPALGRPGWTAPAAGSPAPREQLRCAQHTSGSPCPRRGSGMASGAAAHSSGARVGGTGAPGFEPGVTGGPNPLPYRLATPHRPESGASSIGQALNGRAGGLRSCAGARCSRPRSRPGRPTSPMRSARGTSPRRRRPDRPVGRRCGRWCREG